MRIVKTVVGLGQTFLIAGHERGAEFVMGLADSPNRRMLLPVAWNCAMPRAADGPAFCAPGGGRIRNPPRAGLSTVAAWFRPSTRRPPRVATHGALSGQLMGRTGGEPHQGTAARPVRRPDLVHEVVGEPVPGAARGARLHPARDDAPHGASRDGLGPGAMPNDPTTASEGRCGDHPKHPHRCREAVQRLPRRSGVPAPGAPTHRWIARSERAVAKIPGPGSTPDRHPTPDDAAETPKRSPTTVSTAPKSPPRPSSPNPPLQ